MNRDSDTVDLDCLARFYSRRSSGWNVQFLRKPKPQRSAPSRC